MYLPWTTTTLSCGFPKNELAPKVNSSARNWSARGEFPFPIKSDKFLGRAAREFEHVVIDTKAGEDKRDLEDLAEGCDKLVIPTTAEAMALDALVDMAPFLEEHARGRYKVLLAAVAPWQLESALELIRELKLPVFKTHIPRLEAFNKAAAEGVPVYQVKDRQADRCWQAYVNVAKELMR